MSVTGLRIAWSAKLGEGATGMPVSVRSSPSRLGASPRGDLKPIASSSMSGMAARAPFPPADRPRGSPDITPLMPQRSILNWPAGRRGAAPAPAQPHRPALSPERVSPAGRGIHEAERLRSHVAGASAVPSPCRLRRMTHSGRCGRRPCALILPSVLPDCLCSLARLLTPKGKASMSGPLPGRRQSHQGARMSRALMIAPHLPTSLAK